MEDDYRYPHDNARRGIVESRRHFNLQLLSPSSKLGRRRLVKLITSLCEEGHR